MNIDDQKLIDLVRQHPVLYNFTHPKYMDTGFKQDIWKDIGVKLGVDSFSCKARWNNIRDNYRKSIKKIVLKRTLRKRHIKQYKYSEQLDFLKTFFEQNENESKVCDKGPEWPDKHKPQSDPIMIKEENICEDDRDEAQPIEDLPAESHPEESDVSPSTPRSAKKPKFYMLYRNNRPFVRPPTPPAKRTKYSLKWSLSKKEVSKNAVDSFLSGISPTLQSLNPLLFNYAKSAIFSIVQKYELKMLAAEQDKELTDDSSSQSSSPSPSPQQFLNSD